MKYLDKILNSGKTVFSYNDIEILLGLENVETIKSLIYRLIKTNILIKVYKGIFVFKKYNNFELALKLKKNSYISFETVLKKSAIIFQDYGENIFCASDNTITKQISPYTFTYFKVKNSILQNPIGIINKGNYLIASAERAICDRLYLTSNYYFDNLENIDFEKLEEISQIYNKRVVKQVKKLRDKLYS